MPYKEGRKWRGVVTFQGKRHTGMLDTKREATAWEIEKRKELRSRAKTGMDLLTFCNKYLDYAKRFVKKTYEEKNALVKRILVGWGPETSVWDITPEMAQSYLDSRAESQSGNAYNKDLKNLRVMWSWGQKILGLKTNPAENIEKYPWDRKPQYVPPTGDVLKVLAVANREELVFLNCYIMTGARRSEIFRWTWHEDINFQRSKYRLGTRKTKDGSMEYEWFPMSDELHSELMWWWKSRPMKNTPYVFVNTWGGPSHGQPFKVRRRFLKGLCKRAGVEPFGFHALRSFFASVLADEHKVSAKRIQRLLRHKNLRTTERYIRNINQDLKTTLDLISQTTKIHASHTRKEEGANGENR
jgi:integrase